MAGLLGGLSAPSGLVQVTCKECHPTLLCNERSLVIPAPLRDACDGFLHGSLGGQLARMAAEQWDVICEHQEKRFSDRGDSTVSAVPTDLLLVWPTYDEIKECIKFHTVNN